MTRYFVRLAGPDDPKPVEPTTWRITAGWLELVEDHDDHSITTLIPPTWPFPIGITALFDDDEESDDDEEPYDRKRRESFG